MKYSGPAAAVWLLASSAYAQEASAPRPSINQPRDWAQTLRDDAQAVHAALIDSHPGAHDTLNPDFRKQVDAGLARALQRADQTTDAGGWWWALREYIASFNDGHVSIMMKDQGFQFQTRWPGFLTRFIGDDQRVAATREGDTSVPPLGARLIDCDGVPADELAARRIGQFRGRWFLKAMHVRLGSWLFQDAQNPWIASPTTCRFQVDGSPRDYALEWQVGDDELNDQLSRLQPAAGDFGVKKLQDGGFWISTPSFDGSPQGTSYPKLTSVLEGMQAEQATLRTAPYVVLDLRNNGGGSSHWSRQMANILWGEPWLEVHKMKWSDGVDWRASKANWSALDAFAADLRGAQANPEVLGYLDTMVRGMRTAQEAGEIYWREDLGIERETADAVVTDPVQQVAGKVYVLTDSMCASACLDAVDVWKAAGATQIGRETAADTVYMDTRLEDLPSGLVQMAVPMKVYRGRGRGNNEPHQPQHVLPVEIMDDAALQGAVRELQGN